MSNKREIIRYHPYKRPNKHEVAIRRLFLIKYYQNVKLIRGPCMIPTILNMQTLEYMALSDDLFMKVIDFVSCAKLPSNRNCGLRILARFSYQEFLRRKIRFHPYKRPEDNICKNRPAIHKGFIQASLAELGKMQQREDIQKSKSSYVAKINEVKVEIGQNSTDIPEIPTTPWEDTTTNHLTQKDGIVAALSRNDISPPDYDISSGEDKTTDDKTMKDGIVSALSSDNITSPTYDISSGEDKTTDDKTMKDGLEAALSSENISSPTYDISSVEDTSTDDKTMKDRIVAALSSENISSPTYDFSSGEDKTTDDKTMKDGLEAALSSENISSPTYDISSVEDKTTDDKTIKDGIVAALSSDDITPQANDISSGEDICSSETDCRLPLLKENDDRQTDEQGNTSKDLCASTRSKTENDSLLEVVPLLNPLVPKQDALVDNATNTCQTNDVDNASNTRKPNNENEPLETPNLTKGFTHMPVYDDSDSEIDSETEEALLRIGSDESDCEMSLSETTICRLLEIDPPDKGDTKIEPSKSKSSLVVTQSEAETPTTGLITQIEETHSHLDSNWEQMSSTDSADKHISKSENDKTATTDDTMTVYETLTISCSDQLTQIPPVTGETNINESVVKTTKRVNVTVPSLLTNNDNTQSTISCDTVKTVSTDSGYSVNDYGPTPSIIFQGTNSSTSNEKIGIHIHTTDADINDNRSWNDLGPKAEGLIFTSSVTCDEEPGNKKMPEKICLHKDVHQQQPLGETKPDSSLEFQTKAKTAPTVLEHMQQTSNKDKATPVRNVHEVSIGETKSEISKQSESIEARLEEIKHKDTYQEKHNALKLKMPEQLMPKETELGVIKQAKPKQMKPEVVKVAVPIEIKPNVIKQAKPKEIKLEMVKLAVSKEIKPCVIKQTKPNEKKANLPTQANHTGLKPEEIKQIKLGEMKSELPNKSKEIKQELPKQAHQIELKQEKIKQTKPGEIKPELTKQANQIELKPEVAKWSTQNLIKQDRPKQTKQKEIETGLQKQAKQEEMKLEVVKLSKQNVIKPEMANQAKPKEIETELPKQAKQKKINAEVVKQGKRNVIKPELSKQVKPTGTQLEPCKKKKQKEIKPEIMTKAKQKEIKSELPKQSNLKEIKPQMSKQEKQQEIKQNLPNQTKLEQIKPEMSKQEKQQEIKQNLPNQTKLEQIKLELSRQAEPKEFKQELQKLIRPKEMEFPKWVKLTAIKLGRDKHAKPTEIKPEVTTQAKLKPNLMKQTNPTEIETMAFKQMRPKETKPEMMDQTQPKVMKTETIEKVKPNKTKQEVIKREIQKGIKPELTKHLKSNQMKSASEQAKPKDTKPTSQQEKTTEIKTELFKQVNPNEIETEMKLVKTEGVNKPKFISIPIKFGNDNTPSKLTEEKVKLKPKLLEDKCSAFCVKAVAPKHKYKPAPLSNITGETNKIGASYSQGGAFKQTQESNSVKCSNVVTEKLKLEPREFANKCKPILKAETPKPKFKPVPIKFEEDDKLIADFDPFVPKPKKFKQIQIQFGEDSKQKLNSGSIATTQKFKAVPKNYGENGTPSANARAVVAKPNLRQVPISFGEEKKPTINQDVMVQKLKHGVIPVKIAEDIKPSMKAEAATPKPKFKPVLITFGDEKKPTVNQAAMSTKPKYKLAPSEFGGESKALAAKPKFRPVPITFDKDGHRKIDKFSEEERVEFRKRRFASCLEQDDRNPRKFQMRY